MKNKELDLTVLHLIFGVKRVYYPEWDTQQEYSPSYVPSGKPMRTHHIDAKLIPRFSTDPSACNALKLHMANKFWWLIKSPFYPGQPWWAGLTPHYTTSWNGIPDFNEQGTTEMEAVCKASLRANGFDPEVTHVPKKMLTDE